jgi:hypothetical protein
MKHNEEAIGELIVSGSAVDLEVAAHSLDPIPMLVERLVMLDFHVSI